jgi:hypothetical protein
MQAATRRSCSRHHPSQMVETNGISRKRRWIHRVRFVAVHLHVLVNLWLKVVNIGGERVLRRSQKVQMCLESGYEALVSKFRTANPFSTRSTCSSPHHTTSMFSMTLISGKLSRIQNMSCHETVRPRWHQILDTRCRRRGIRFPSARVIVVE